MCSSDLLVRRSALGRPQPDALSLPALGWRTRSAVQRDPRGRHRPHDADLLRPGGADAAADVALAHESRVLPGFMEALPSMFLAAASVALVASLDVLISAKVVEAVSGQRGNSTRELLCMGAANTVTPLLGGIMGSISLAATTANFRAGARNSLSLCVHGLLFLVLVPVCAPLLGFIPKVVIATLILFAGVGLFDRWTFQLLKRIELRRR